MEASTIYTIGHSTHTLADFLAMLKSFGIKTLCDVRSLPGSNKFRQYNQDSLKASLAEVGIEYLHLTDLGGRRKARKDSENSTWRNNSFKGYADYMETKNFEEAAENLAAIALKQPTVYMCAEAVWWRCHRAMISDFLKAKGWTVLHIMAEGKAQEHPYTSPAHVTHGKVSYHEEV